MGKNSPDWPDAAGGARPDIDPLLPPEAAAAAIGVHPDTLANWRVTFGQRKIPFVKLNRRDVRYRKSAVIAFIDRCDAETATVVQKEAERRLARVQETAKGAAK